MNREQSKTSILVLAIAAVFFCFLPAHAEVAIKTEIGASSFFVGEGFVYTLTVNGAKQVEEPETPIHSDFFVNALETKIQEHDILPGGRWRSKGQDDFGMPTLARIGQAYP